MVILGGIFNQTEPIDYDDDYEYKEEDGANVGANAGAVWISLLYSVLVIIGLLGNGLLLAVLVHKRRSWSISDSFILQLCVVDILLLVTLPFYAAHDNQSCGWCSPTFLKICGAVFKINLYIGIFVLVCICLDHYLSSICAAQCCSHRANFAFMGCLLVWFVSIALTVLDGKFLLPNTESVPGKALSAHSPPKSGDDWQLISRALHLGVGFFLPAVIQIVCCSHIMLQCRSKRQNIRIRPVVLILSLVGAFLLCWIPYNITLFIDTICYTSKDFLNKFFVDHVSSLKTAVKVTSAVGCISACLRPLLYFSLCGNFRKGIFSLLKCAKVECNNSLWELGVSEEGPHVQCHFEDEMKQMTATS
ncbi:C-X-C chemokine receptor type 3-like [Anableps anableps]